MSGEYPRQPGRAKTLRREPEADMGGVSEITILPDGRLYVLGLSAAVLRVLDAAGPWEGRPWADSPALGRCGEGLPDRAAPHLRAENTPGGNRP